MAARLFVTQDEHKTSLALGMGGSRPIGGVADAQARRVRRSKNLLPLRQTLMPW
jgi:hypothetical protein